MYHVCYQGVVLLETPGGESCDGDSHSDDDGEVAASTVNIVVIGANIKTGKSSIRVNKQTTKKVRLTYVRGNDAGQCRFLRDCEAG